MQEVVIIGAGKIGRGYAAKIFFEEGYRIIFVDFWQEIVDEINDKKQYEIHEVDSDTHEVFKITGVSAIHGKDESEVVEAISRVSVLVTAVGAGNLPKVAYSVAKAITFRAQNQIFSPLNVIMAENLKDGARKFREMIEAYLDEETLVYLDHYVGIACSAIGRMIPPPPPSFKSHSIADVIVEPHQEFVTDITGLKRPIPIIRGIDFTEDYQAAVARKLYIHNCTHAIMAYIGSLYGHDYSHDAMMDERVSSVVWQAMQETARAVAVTYGLDKNELADYIQKLFLRYQNHELWDTLKRVGRDPIRKLQPDDRLIGSVRLVQKVGGDPRPLVEGIAAAYCYHDPEDQSAVQLQEMIAERGLVDVLKEISDISAGEALGESIIKAITRLREDKRPV